MFHFQHYLLWFEVWFWSCGSNCASIEHFVTKIRSLMFWFWWTQIMISLRAPSWNLLIGIQKLSLVYRLQVICWRALALLVGFSYMQIGRYKVTYQSKQMLLKSECYFLLLYLYYFLINCAASVYNFFNYKQSKISLFF